MADIEKIKSGKKNIFLVDKKYVVKNATKKILEAEKIFIEKYNNLKMEKIIESNIEKNYIIYKYIKGTIINKMDDVDNCLIEVYNIVKKYIDIDVEGYGDILCLNSSWEEFLKQETDKKSKYIKEEVAEMKNIVYEKIKIIGEKQIQKKLIHGDLGSFNIICKNRKIVGIIDPRTIVGDPLYDFIYFIFSNRNLTNKINFEDIFRILADEDKEKIFAYIYILLYDRICIEQKNNTGADQEFYKIWLKIQELERKILAV